MAAKIAHIVFGKLAQETLRVALRNHGLQEIILTFPDDLSFGPIEAIDGALRLKWIGDNFHLTPQEWGVFPCELRSFVQEIESRFDKIICWISSNSVYEICGFCELVQKIVPGMIYFIDTMDYDLLLLGKENESGESPAPRLAHMNPVMVSHLIGTEALVSASLRSERLGLWRRLRVENAPFRTIGVNGIESAPLSHFDKFLLVNIGADWRPAGGVVACTAVEANNDNFFRVDMIALTGRLRALVAEGVIEASGDLSDWATVNVRLSQSLAQ